MENMFRLLAVLFLLALCKARGDEDPNPCPPGFVFNNKESCYKLFPLRATWPEAVVFCKTFGAKLSKITDQEEQSFIEYYISSNFTNVQLTLDVWLGGTDLLVDGEWVWTDGYKHLNYTNWLPDEPNNQGRSEDCLALVPSKGFKWNDASCTFHANFLCEVELGSNTIG